MHWGYLNAKPKKITTERFDEGFDLERQREIVQLGRENVRKYYRVSCLDRDDCLGDIEDYVKAW